MYCSYISDHLPLWWALLDKWSRIQSSRRRDWVRRTRVKATHLLEHILLQDLSRYEDQSTAQVHCRPQAGSLHSLIADGQYRATSLGRDKWKELIGFQGSLQANCNKEGFNVVCSWRRYSKARIGIVSENKNECGSCDSRIGFGTKGQPDDSNTCGNEAVNNPDNGNKHLKAMGYILVQ